VEFCFVLFFVSEKVYHFSSRIFFHFFVLYLIVQIKHAPNKKLRHNKCKKDSHRDKEISTFHTSTCKEGDSIYICLLLHTMHGQKQR